MPESPFTRFYSELQSRLDPVTVVGQHVKLKQGTRSYRGLCPFHGDTDESFHIYLDDKHYHCFGCQVHGNLIDFVAKVRNLEYREAANQLARTVGLEVPTRRQSSSELQFKEVFSVIGKANSLYRQALLENVEAKQYLAARGIGENVIKKFSIGYAPADWEFLAKSLRRTRPDLLAKTGLLRSSSEGHKYDWFRDRIMFPIRDFQGRVRGFGGRVFKKNSMSGINPKYINSPDSPLFKKKDLLYGLFELSQVGYRHDRLLLVEGYMDVVGLAQHGIDYALAVLGTAPNHNHFVQMFSHTQEVIVCFDGDEAGRRAARRSLSAILPELTSGKSVRFMFLPEGCDPDSLVREKGKSGFEEMLNESLSIVQYLKMFLLEGRDIQELDVRIDFVNGAIDLLSKIPNEITRTIFIDELLKIFPEDEIRGQLDRVLKNRYEPELTETRKQDNNVRRRPANAGASNQLTSRVADVRPRPHRAMLAPSVAEKRIVRGLLLSPEISTNLGQELMERWHETFGPSLLYRVWEHIVTHGLSSPSAILGSLQGDPISDVLHGIYDDTYSTSGNSDQVDSTKQNLLNEKALEDLKTSIENTISKQQLKENRATEFKSSDVYKRESRTALIRTSGPNTNQNPA